MNAHRSPLQVTVVGLLLIILGVLQLLAFGNPERHNTNSKQIEVRLIPKKKSTKVGEILEVRVEIWNVGSEPLFIEKAIYDPCGPASPLSLELELGPPMKSQAGIGCAHDCIYNTKDSFARRLVDHWTSLPPGHFYGGVVAMHPDHFPELKTPGRWRLRGTYKSGGNLSSPSSPCMDLAPIPDNEEQIKGLPYKAWQGQVVTNLIWIEVVTVGSSSKAKKSS